MNNEQIMKLIKQIINMINANPEIFKHDKSSLNIICDLIERLNDLIEF